MALSQSEAEDAARQLARKMFVELVATANMPHDVLWPAVAAIDSFLDTNAGPINSALPVAFRTTATPAQKLQLISFCCAKRAGLLG